MMESDRESGASGACATTQEWLPLLGEVGRLPEGLGDEVLAHLRGCASCAAEARLVASLQRLRPEPPPGLALRIVTQSGVALGPVLPRRPRFRWLGAPLAAAALVLLTLFAPRLFNPASEAEENVGMLAILDIGGGDLRSELWFVAGEALLDGLPDDLLLQLAIEVEEP